MTTLTIRHSNGLRAHTVWDTPGEAALVAALSRQSDPGVRIRSYTWTPRPVCNTCGKALREQEVRP